MAFKKMIAQHLSKISRKITNPAFHHTAPIKMAPDPGDKGIFRRYLHRNMAAATPTGPRPFLPAGEKLLEKLRGLDVGKNRIRLDWLSPVAAVEEEELPKGEMTAADVKKIVRFSQIENVKSKLREGEKDFVSYSEFLDVCVKESLSKDQGLEFAKILDESGGVMVVGDIVFLRPEKVVKAIHGLLMPISPKTDDPRMKALEEMEEQKAAIDQKAESYVRKEMWSGLGYLVIQTAVFMRLTYWELSWEVMEPICFYVTSMYFMGGYAFFLRTSKEPSFEGFFQSRFGARQKRLMNAQEFDVERYNELKKTCCSKSLGDRM